LQRDDLGVELPDGMSTDRLLLRRIENRDVPALADLRQQDLVREFLGGVLSPEDALAKARACVNTREHYAVVRHDDGRFVGLTSLTPRGSETELSYEFLPDAWGQGLATEACAVLLEAHASVATSGDGIIAVTQRANQRSRGLLERLGMTVREEFVEHCASQVLYSRSPSATSP
jgi:RimJ/RimL family protein N-acetyltransferase